MNDGLRKEPELGKTLKYLRNRVGVSQKDLVEKLRDQGSDMTVAWYSKIESRSGSYPNSNDLEQILSCLGSDTNELNSLLKPTPVVQNISNQLPDQMNWKSTGLSYSSLAAGPQDFIMNDSPAPIQKSNIETTFDQLTKENQAAVMAYARVKLREQGKN